MRVLIVGKGFVESHLNPKFERSPVRLTVNENEIKQFVDGCKADVIINCIAKTGRPNVDWCETHREETILANVTLPTLLAQQCNARGIHYIHIGSGCIFYGDSPHASKPNGLSDPGWSEKDFANPKSFYSKTKYACDLAIQDLENTCIMRIRMPISKTYTQRNYLNKIFAYSKILDSLNSVTFMDDLVRGIDWAIDKKKRGVYHLTNPEPISAVDFVNLYREMLPLQDSQFKIINEAELGALTTAVRSNCIIDNSKIMAEGFAIAPASQQARAYVYEYVIGRMADKMFTNGT